MGMSTYLANKLYDHVMRNTAYTPPATVYAALFTTMPDADDVGGVEVAGGSYARQAVAFSPPTLGVGYNSAVETFSTLPACDVVGAGLYDAAVAGNLLFLGTYAFLHSVAAGASEDVLIGDLVVVFS